MANVIVPFPGADARQVEQMVAFPLEQKLAEIDEVKHTYSVSRPGMAVLTVEYEVGVKRQPALVRLYDKVFSRSEEHTSELQSLMRISYAVFCLKKKKQ